MHVEKTHWPINAEEQQKIFYGKNKHSFNDWIVRQQVQPMFYHHLCIFEVDKNGISTTNLQNEEIHQEFFWWITRMVNNFKCLHRQHHSVDGEWFLHVDTRICLIANVVPYWNLLICIWCYFIKQWNKWVKYYFICVYKIPLTSYKSTWAKGSSTIVIMCCLSSVRD